MNISLMQKVCNVFALDFLDALVVKLRIGTSAPIASAVPHLATLIGVQSLVVGWRHGFDLASLVICVTTVMQIYMATEPVVPEFFPDLVMQINVAKDPADFLTSKP